MGERAWGGWAYGQSLVVLAKSAAYGCKQRAVRMEATGICTVTTLCASERGGDDIALCTDASKGPKEGCGEEVTGHAIVHQQLITRRGNHHDVYSLPQAVMEPRIIHTGS